MKKLFTVLPLVLATSAAMAYEQDKTYQFTILHTNNLPYCTLMIRTDIFGRMQKVNMAFQHTKQLLIE